MPEKEIADAHLTARTDEEIGIGKIGGVEMPSELFFSDRRRIVVAVVATALGEDGVHGIDNFGAAAVVQSYRKNHAGVRSRSPDRVARVFLDGERQIVRATEKEHTDVVALDERHFIADILAKQLHEKFNFGLGTAPVLDRKGVEGQGFDIEAGAGFDGGAGRFDTRAVADDVREMTHRRLGISSDCMAFRTVSSA